MNVLRLEHELVSSHNTHEDKARKTIVDNPLTDAQNTASTDYAQQVTDIVAVVEFEICDRR
jgi:hypothetical protein